MLQTILFVFFSTSKDPVVVAAADQRIAVSQSQCAENIDSVTVVVGRFGLIVQIQLVLPDDFALRIVFADAAQPFVADQIIAVV